MQSGGGAGNAIPFLQCASYLHRGREGANKLHMIPNAVNILQI